MPDEDNQTIDRQDATIPKNNAQDKIMGKYYPSYTNEQKIKFFDDLVEFVLEWNKETDKDDKKLLKDMFVYRAYDIARGYPDCWRIYETIGSVFISDEAILLNCEI